MKTKLLHDSGEKTFAVIFDKGDEVAAGLLDFAKSERIAAARFTAIGAFSVATLGYFDRERKEYKEIPIDEQVEVLSLMGTISLQPEGDAPQVHAHAVVGTADGTARGGHLLKARVWPTLEVIVVEEPDYLRRAYDPETGLSMIVAS